ncbi:hypothetical protein J4225_03015 [Candidatus Pacearchaeota archaeon]|nr:hypothetical protein [uncultured archaeon]MBS3085631.1 hypothetical protein [Candidatus Pacearchaeota archaeon]
MLKKSMSKSEIETELKSKGDFVQIDYLAKYVSEKPAFDMKKFAYQKLAEIYERRYMFGEAAKTYGFIADLALTFTEKIKFNSKQVELYVKAGMFERADECMQTTLSNANASQKAEVMFAIKEFYKKQALVYEKEKRRAHAAKVYEKLASMNLSETEKEEVRNKLLHLYEELGKIKEYMMLKGKID